MKYEIVIREIISNESEKYPEKKEVYSQQVDDLDIKSIVAVVNHISNMPPTFAVK